MNLDDHASIFLQRRRQNCAAGWYAIRDDHPNISMVKCALGYKKTSPALVTAVQLNLDTDGISCRKSAWVRAQRPGRVETREGGTTCKLLAYLVHNKADASDFNTIEGAVFEGLYEKLSA